MRKYGLIGKTLKHSFSQTYFTEKFAREGLTDCVYANYELSDIGELDGILKDPELCGFNITIPYKTEVLSFLDEQDQLVQAIGACNCVHIKEGKRYGYNTDAIAFRDTLKRFMKKEHECALVLGAGGASKAVRYALESLGISYALVSRHKKEGELGYEDIGEEAIARHQVIINTTPLGMFPNTEEAPSIPYEALTPSHLLYDLTYNPPKTKFLREGEKRGAAIVNGYEMLVGQAEESWRIWNSV
jgi:shikimate dehydrogenase